MFDHTGVIFFLCKRVVDIKCQSVRIKHGAQLLLICPVMKQSGKGAIEHTFASTSFFLQRLSCEGFVAFALLESGR